MTKPKGTDEEAIGRPGPWGENRYQEADKSVDESVHTPPGTQPNADGRPSKPVTRRDYQSPESVNDESETAGGDAG